MHSSNKISHGRFLVDRYARRLVYVALTASIVVPVILLATRDHLPDPAALLAPLDESIALDGSGTIPLDNRGPWPRRGEDMGPPAPMDQPVMASLAPFYPSSRSTAPAPAAAQAVASQDGLVLVVSGESWVEVVGHQGDRLVHELMRSGDRHQLDPKRVARVLLGNAAAVKVQLDGVDVDTNAYRRANVARFTVSSDGSLAPVSSG